MARQPIFSGDGAVGVGARVCSVAGDLAGFADGLRCSVGMYGSRAILPFLPLIWKCCGGRRVEEATVRAYPGVIQRLFGGCARTFNVGTTSTLHNSGGHRVECHLPAGKMVDDCVRRCLSGCLSGAQLIEQLTRPCDRARQSGSGCRRCRPPWRWLSLSPWWAAW